MAFAIGGQDVNWHRVREGGFRLKLFEHHSELIGLLVPLPGEFVTRMAGAVNPARKEILQVST
jgi:hypothetical protein